LARAPLVIPLCGSSQRQALADYTGAGGALAAGAEPLVVGLSSSLESPCQDKRVNSANNTTILARTGLIMRVIDPVSFYLSCLHPCHSIHMRVDRYRAGQVV